MKQLGLITAILFSITLLTGCQSGPMIESPFAINATDALQIHYMVSWATPLNLPSSSRVVLASILDDLIIVIEKPNNLVTAINVRDGQIRWRHVVASETDKLFTPFRDGQGIFINSETHLFKLALDNGRLLEITDLDSVVNASAGHAQNLAIFGGLNGKVFGHQLTSGYAKWTYLMPASIIAPPVADNNDVFVADKRGHYAMFDVLTGKQLYSGRTFGRISVAPLVSRLSVFIASEDQSLYVINRTTGQDRWQFAAGYPLNEPISILGRTVFVPLPNQGLLALDTRTGKKLWHMADNLKPIAQSDTQLILSGTSHLYVADPRTGKLITQVPVHKLAAALPINKQAILLVTTRGRLLRLDSQK